MKQTPGTSKDAADKLVRGIKRKTRKHYSAEEKIRIVLAGLRGEESISALCRREGIAESLYCSWSKEFLEAGTPADVYHGRGAPILKAREEIKKATIRQRRLQHHSAAA
jgi:transposase